MLERNNIIIMIFKHHIITYAVISENTITLRVWYNVFLVFFFLPNIWYEITEKHYKLSQSMYIVSFYVMYFYLQTTVTFLFFSNS